LRGKFTTKATNKNTKATNNVCAFCALFCVFCGEFPPQLLGNAIEPLLEAARVRPFGARERLEPFGDLFEALFTSRACETRVHLGIFVCLARDRGFEVLCGVADGLAGRGIADLLQEIEVAMRMAGLAFCRVAEQSGEVRVALDIGLARAL
jgi:hypothetical protein